MIRVFISELMLSGFSDALQLIIRESLDAVPAALLSSSQLMFQGSIFTPLSYRQYNQFCPAELLEQSSTLADRIEVEFTEGKFVIPACYYEFARRYEQQDGNLFSGFIADSADKIIESTHYRK